MLICFWNWFLVLMDMHAHTLLSDYSVALNLDDTPQTRHLSTQYQAIFQWYFLKDKAYSKSEKIKNEQRLSEYMYSVSK